VREGHRGDRLPGAGQQYDQWIIDGLDDLAECSLAAQQRFVNLVDVLYDQDRQLTVIGKRALEESLGGRLPT
jgi:cell division protein ZapE